MMVAFTKTRIAAALRPARVAKSLSPLALVLNATHSWFPQGTIHSSGERERERNKERHIEGEGVTD